jgi:hypothetical protein
MALAPARPAIKLKTGVKFPARVLEGAGIDIALANGAYTFSLDYPSLVNNAGIPDPSIYRVAIYNVSTLQYEEAPLDQVRGTTVAAVRTPRGDADYTMISTDRYVGLTAALTAPRTWALPSAAAVVGGTQIDVKDEAGGITSTNTLTITAPGAETINGGASFVLNVAYAGARFISDGTSKWTLALVGTTGYANSSITNAKLANMAALTVKANATNGSAAPTDVAAGTDGYLFKRTGTTLDFSQAVTASLSDGILSADATGRAKMAAAFFSADATGLGKFADGFLTADATGRAKMADRFNTFAKLPAIATARLLGRTTASSGDIEELTAASAQSLLGLFTLIGSLNNAGLSASVGSNALTIALTDAAGATPSATSPAQIPFRSAAAATGTISQASVTAANTLVISSGSTLGTTSATPFRIWIVLFDDAGTYRLGAINCRSSTGIFPLTTHGVLSSTAEGGAGAADSAQVFYTGTAVTTKAYTVLGYLEWASGLTTAGTWDALPTWISVFKPGDPLPGAIVQPIFNPVSTSATGTTVLPFDNTIPQITEGVEFMTQAITPTSAANDLEISASTYLYNSAATNVTVALFQDATAGALAANAAPCNVASGYGISLPITHRMRAGTTASTTFRIRGGGDIAGTTTFNGTSGVQKFGGVLNSFLSVVEIMA